MYHHPTTNKKNKQTIAINPPPQQANGRGYWETDEENLELLRELYEEVEDRIEGL